MSPKLFVLLLLSVCWLAGAKAQQIPPPPIAPRVWPNAPWDKVTDKLKKELSLDNSQKKQVKEAYKTYYTEVGNYVNSETGEEQPKGKAPEEDPLPSNNPAIVKLINKRNLKIKKVLSAEQYQQYLSLAKSYDQMPFNSAHGPVFQ